MRGIDEERTLFDISIISIHLLISFLLHTISRICVHLRNLRFKVPYGTVSNQYLLENTETSISIAPATTKGTKPSLCS